MKYSFANSGGAKALIWSHGLLFGPQLVLYDEYISRSFLRWLYTFTPEPGQEAAAYSSASNPGTLFAWSSRTNRVTNCTPAGPPRTSFSRQDCWQNKAPASLAAAPSKPWSSFFKILRKDKVCHWTEISHLPCFSEKRCCSGAGVTSGSHKRTMHICPQQNKTRSETLSINRSTKILPSYRYHSNTERYKLQTVDALHTQRSQRSALARTQTRRVTAAHPAHQPWALLHALAQEWRTRHRTGDRC